MAPIHGPFFIEDRLFCDFANPADPRPHVYTGAVTELCAWGKPGVFYCLFGSGHRIDTNKSMRRALGPTRVAQSKSFTSPAI